MRMACGLFWVLILLVSVEFIPASGHHGSRVVRIPEHTCHKRVYMNTCETHSCNQECSKELFGVGQCRARVCSCTYYCKQPPV